MLGMPDALVIVGILGTVAVAVLKMVPSKTNGYVRSETCKVQHKSIAESLHSIDQRLQRIEDALLQKETKAWRM